MEVAIAAGVAASGGKTDSESMVKAFEGLDFDTPDGKMSFRKIDRQEPTPIRSISE